MGLIKNSRKTSFCQTYKPTKLRNFLYHKAFNKEIFDYHICSEIQVAIAIKKLYFDEIWRKALE
jgi:hypothetical protein